MLLAGVAALGLAASATIAHAAVTYGPENTVTVSDPSPVNWLSVTWMTMEEADAVNLKGKTVYALADSWKWVNPTTLELKLRKDVKYQDGTPFTAKNLKTAFDKVNDWSQPHPPGKFLNWAKGSKAEIKDDYTIDIVLPEPDSAAFMKLRGMHVPSNAFWDKLGFVDKKTGSANGHWWVIDAAGPWGTGPFVLAEGVSQLDKRSPEVVLQPNEAYWNPDRKPTVRLVFDNIISKADALKAVAAGDKKLDIVTQLTPADAKAFDGKGNAHIVSDNAKTVLAGVFNQTEANSPWKNIKLRQAMNMAIDRAALLKDAGGGYGVLMPAFIQKGRFGQDASLKQYPYDVAKAKAEIKKDGMEGKEITIGAAEEYAPLVKQIGEQLEKVGLKAKMVDAKDKKADMTLVWHFDWSPEYPVGVVYREFFGTGGGFLEGADTKKFDELADKVIATEDLQKQAKAVSDIEAYEHEQANVLFLYSPATIFAVSNRTIFQPSDTFMFDGATIKLKTTKAEK